MVNFNTILQGAVMIEARYEKYKNLTNDLPFILNEDIVRSSVAFSQKQNWHDNIEIQVCTAGQGFVLIDGKKHPFNTGDIVVIDSNAIHYTYSQSSITYSCIIIGTEFCKQMGIDYDTLSFTPIIKDNNLVESISLLRNTYHKDEPMRIAKLNQQLLGLLIKITLNYSSAKKITATQEKGLNAVKNALFFIREHYSEKISLDEIAKFTFVDKYTLCKEFKKFTGQTIFENLNVYRCIKASEQISNGKSVAEAAYSCGFENLSFFTKTFKKHMHQLPSKQKKNT